MEIEVLFVGFEGGSLLERSFDNYMDNYVHRKDNDVVLLLSDYNGRKTLHSR